MRYNSFGIRIRLNVLLAIILLITGTITRGAFSSDAIDFESPADEYEQEKSMQVYSNEQNYSPEEIYSQLSRIYSEIQNNDIASANMNIRNLLSNQENNTTLIEEIYNVAANCSRMGKHDFAVKFYQEFLFTWPQAKLAPYATKELAIECSMIGDEKQALFAMEKLKTDYGEFPNKTESFYKLGLYYSQSKKAYSQAADLFAYVINNCSKDESYTMRAHFELVKCYFLAGEIEKSTLEYKDTIALYADNPSIVSNICSVADTYLQAGDANSAKVRYKEVLEKWPGEHRAIFAKAGLAKVESFYGHDKDVNDIINEIFDTDAENPYIAVTIFNIANEYWREATKERAKLGRRIRGSTFVRSEIMDNKLKMAILIWEKLITYLPESRLVPEAYKSLAACFTELDKYEEAIECYHIIIKQYPEFEDVEECLFMLGRVYRSCKLLGLMTSYDADIRMEETNRYLVENYPDSYFTKGAQKWLTSREKETAESREPPKTYEEKEASFRAFLENKKQSRQY